MSVKGNLGKMIVVGTCESIKTEYVGRHMTQAPMPVKLEAEVEGRVTYYHGAPNGGSDKPTQTAEEARREREKKARKIMIIGLATSLGEQSRQLAESLKGKGEVIVIDGHRLPRDIGESLMIQPSVKDTCRHGQFGVPPPGRAWQGKGQKRKNKKDRWR